MRVWGFVYAMMMNGNLNCIPSAVAGYGLHRYWNSAGEQGSTTLGCRWSRPKHHGLKPYPRTSAALAPRLLAAGPKAETVPGTHGRLWTPRGVLAIRMLTMQKWPGSVKSKITPLGLGIEEASRGAKS